MSTLAPAPAQLALRSAMEARDLEAVVAAFAPDAVLNSPLTARFSFRGHDQIRAIVEVILDVFADLRYTDELLGEASAFLVSRARVGRQELEIVDHLRLNPDGKIREFTVFMRPLPATATALRLIGMGLGRRRSKRRARLISFLTRPLTTLTRTGDGIGVALIRSTVPPAPKHARKRGRRKPSR
jgi:hypothetical protein